MNKRLKAATNSQSRRTFIKKSILGGAALPLFPGDLSWGGHDPAATPLKVHIFSKHLQFLNEQDMAEAAAEIGFDGIDLTVRPKGHVQPERVEEELPGAVEAMRKVGFAPSMMTTAVQDPDNPTDRQVLETAAKLGMQYYRMSYFRYQDDKSIPESLRYFQQRMEALSQLNSELGLTGCYQNHAGNYVGASIWELWELLKKADSQSMGAQYDIRHAVVEGGMSWPNSLRLIQPHIKTLAIKDFIWEKKNGKWYPRNTPLGEGMVDFKTYFQLLKKYRIQAPISLHLEYPIGGAEHGDTKLSVDKQIVFDAMKKDLKTVREWWQHEG
ncbi:L-ribulose-5-phosphate 3-epimerase [Catalinimonas alkaloidigena]|uniref:sugar phosphate isomerase/epimerase family protein n=1 Tax=Catalinimonas alkaloidigena TaxID=1075417 RepID=UPI002405B439|nr:sugar phosphate isomerase/epimerase family protein [Catalinimonas alkaloidigena]MDF9799322.1 L-ribulose-5-phosphate 3-epimerase [Catalinimonas alkaloidigena]